MAKKTKKPETAPATVPSELHAQASAELPVEAKPVEAKPLDRAVNMSISLPMSMVERIRGLQETVLPGVKIGASDVIKYLCTEGLRSHDAKTGGAK